MHTNVFDRVSNFVAEADLLRHRLNQNKGRRNVGGVNLHVFDATSAGPKRLARFQVFHSVKLERISHFTENALRYFQTFSGEFVNFVFRLEETSQRDEDRDDGWRKNVRTKVSGGFVAPENSEENKKDAKAQAAENERAGIFHLRRGAAPERFFRHDPTCSRRSREHKPVITQAFVLAAGLGTRLRPLTDDLPKPLVPIWQKRLITFALDHLIAAGVEKFHLNTHHRPECFVEIFPDATYRDHELRFHHEPELLETAGGIANIADAIEPTALLVYNADVLTDLPLAALIEAHFRDKNLLTLALRSGGVLRDIALDPDSRCITGIRNQIGTDHKFGFTGVYILSFDFLQRFERGVKRSVIPHFVDAIRKGERIGGVVIEEGDWWEVGTPGAYVQLHRELRGRERFPSYPVDQGWRDSIHPAAKVAGDAIMEGCSVVGKNAVVGAGAVVRDTIVWPGAQIASRSELQDCIVRTRQRAEGILQNVIV